MEAERFMVDDLLNFTLDVCGEVVDDDENDKNTLKPPPSSSLELLDRNTQDPEKLPSLSPEFAEEELEWLSNKDAFPAVETCLELLSDHHPGIVLNHQSPVSVLETATTTTASSSTSNSNSSSITTCPVNILVPWRYPMKARSKQRLRRRRGFSDLSSQHCWWWNQAKVKSSKKELPRLPPAPPSATRIGRRCQHCQVDKTPQWRAGPMGPKTLCNACGVRYKSGRLVPEYRPACSPTFSSQLHSNSHRKVMEMRKQKEMGGGGMTVANGAC
ncbi:hypothetical protein RHMOL_Rhmol02G0056100 [Rhododendron molle]|uniref:Uncharacterized protein n=1 Tax=Rhododendron molle TaxID=49168 RepID=A0ACC0PLS2_RHOML|nr:hypothetical protein RHMOL_Rhmol02G0056100 [Rhododendron molle]